MENTEWIFRLPNLQDGAALHGLIRDCPPLDVNSSYLYFLLCDHFRETCIVFEREGLLRGCVTGYRKPDRPDTLFIWQVAVHKDARGQGLGTRMLNALTDRPGLADIRWMETTISPSNSASRRLFASWAELHECRMEESPFLKSEDFSTDQWGAEHEEECLFRIGPLHTTLTSPEKEKDPS